MKYTFFVIMLFFLITCTNPFTTRDPETPEATDNTEGFEDARTPELLFTNFEKSIEEKNVSEHMKCFADPGLGHEKTYRFQPEANLSDFLINRWTKQDEQNYFIKITEEERADFPRISFNALDDPVFQPINVSSPDDSVETRIFRYQLSITRIDTVQVYTGQMKIRAFQSRATDSNWYIYRWDDFAIDNQLEATWTFLKFENR